MKSLTQLCVSAIIVLSATSFVRAADPAPVNIHFSVIQQVSLGPINMTTNVSKTVTNIIEKGRNVVTNYVIDDARLLRMLANSYNTNFPTNATIKMFGLGGIGVVVGTNLILDPGAIMSLSTGSGWIFSGTQRSRQTYGPKGYVSVLGEDQTFHFPSIFVYDDSSLTTRDGTTTQFAANGIQSFHHRSVTVNNQEKYTFDILFTGSGVGTNSTSSSLNRLVIMGDISAHISSPH